MKQEDQHQTILVSYAYALVTDKGIYAVISHAFEDSLEVENDSQWHAHGVTLDEKNCVPKISIKFGAPIIDEGVFTIFK